jgi:hypothetical protein
MAARPLLQNCFDHVDEDQRRTRVVMKVCMQWVIYGEGHNFTEEYIDGTALSYEVSQQAVFLVIALWIFLLHSLRLP